MQRSAAIRKIERDLIELSRMFQEVGELVQQQEPAVEQANADAEETKNHIGTANTQLDSAITSARKARKWKWYALIIISTSPSLEPKWFYCEDSATNMVF